MNRLSGGHQDGSSVGFQGSSPTSFASLLLASKPELGDEGAHLCVTASPEPPASLDQVSGQAGLPSSMAARDQAGEGVRGGSGAVW